MHNAVRDGLMMVPHNGCPSGWHKIVIYASEAGYNYHVYRQDPDGSWSNKDGEFNVTNCRSRIVQIGGYPSIISMPIRLNEGNISNDARDHGTPTKCGSLCAPNDPRRLIAYSTD